MNTRVVFRIVCLGVALALLCGRESMSMAAPDMQPPADGGAAGLAEPDSVAPSDEDAATTGVAPGSTGALTPAVRPQQDAFAITHRSIRADQDLKIQIEHQTHKGVRVKRLLLVFPSGSAGDKKLRSTPPQAPEKTAIEEIELTDYVSLDASGSTLHVDLDRAYEINCRKKPYKYALCAWDYALFGNQPTSLLITYTLADGGKDGQEARTVTLHPELTNVGRGLFWGLLGFLFSACLTLFIGHSSKPKSFLSGQPIVLPRRVDRLWHYILGITLSPENRYSVSALQVVIWTHVAAYGIAYVWTMTGQIVEISGQMLALLGVGGVTAVLSRFSSASGVNIPDEYLRLLDADRAPKLSDLVTSGDTPSIFKFQMLIFTALSAGIVAWEVTRSYVFPALPTELVVLMGMSNATYLLGGVSDKTGRKDIYVAIGKTIADIEQQIKEHSPPAGQPSLSSAWTRASIVESFRHPRREAPLPDNMNSALRELKELLERLFV